MQIDVQREIETEREVNEQWEAGGTVPDLDETWATPMDDPDATVPLRR